VQDTTPQLGGDLDLNGNKITSNSNGDVTIDPAGTGAIVLKSDNIKLEGAGTVTLSTLKFYEAPLLEGNFIGLKPPLSITNDVTLELPGADGDSGDCLVTSGSGVLSFSPRVQKANAVTENTLSVKAVTALNTPGRLLMYDDDNANTVTIQTPAAADLPASWTLTLPQNDGTSGQVLSTNGSGVTSWADSSGGGGGITELPFFNTSGRFTWSSADDGERVLLGSSYGPSSFYSHSLEPSDSTWRVYSADTINSTTETAAAYFAVNSMVALPTDSKKVRAKITYRVQNGNSGDFGFSMWSVDAAPDNGATANQTVTLRAASTTTTVGTSSIATYTDEFTTTSALSGGGIYFLAEHRSGSLTSTTYMYFNLQLYLID